MISRLGPVLLTASLCAGACRKSNPAPVSDGTLLTPYLEIQETLARDEIDKLPALGAAVVGAAKDRAGDPGVAKIVQGAGRIAAQDIATARSAFKTMSEGMIEYVKADASKQAATMLVHCPMTFAGAGGAWIQRKGKVMNPYEGAMMLHCGEKIEWNETPPSTPSTPST